MKIRKRRESWRVKAVATREMSIERSNPGREVELIFFFLKFALVLIVFSDFLFDE